MSDPFVEDAGAYVLGILPPEERSAFSAHLRECEACQQAVAEIEDLPGLLALVPAEGPADPPPSVLAGLLGEVERLERADELAARRARRGRTAWWAGVGVAAAVVGGVASGVVPTPWTTQDEAAVVATTVELSGAADVPVTASVDLLPVRWGTKVELTCAYTAGQYAQPVEYALVVHDADGRSEEVATWTAVPGAELTVPAATAIPLEEITRVEMTWEGEVVLSAQL